MDSPEGISLSGVNGIHCTLHESLGENRDMQAKGMTVHLQSLKKDINNVSYR